MRLPSLIASMLVVFGSTAAGVERSAARQDAKPALPPATTGASAKLAAPGPLAGLDVLIIGASQFAHDGYLISTLHTGLQDKGATVATYGACASIPEGWVVPQHVPCGTSYRIGTAPIVTDNGKAAMTWPVHDLIQTHHPRLVIVGIADSLAGYRQPELPAGWLQQQVHRLTTAIQSEHVACIWLGTTWGSEGGPLGKTFARVKQLSDALKQDAGPCEYIDSLAFSQPGEWATIDGQHHTASAYGLWGAAASNAIERTGTVRALLPNR